MFASNLRIVSCCCKIITHFLEGIKFAGRYPKKSEKAQISRNKRILSNRRYKKNRELLHKRTLFSFFWINEAILNIAQTSDEE